MPNKSLAGAHGSHTILVTGGSGFIGSHTCVELLEEGYRVVILDDLSNSSIVVVDRIRELTHATDELVFIQASILDRDALTDVFSTYSIDAIIHFAGFKAVGESTQKPLEYYWNNVTGSMVLVDVARTFGVKNIIFSSSATVYGEPDVVPITEDSPVRGAESPYGETKAMVERILSDLYRSDHEWNIVLLRYFNPIGAHPSGRIGEDPKGIPNNLVPYVAQVAIGKLKAIQVFGNNYPTPDGTGVRDYIHVVDLARGHVKALAYMAGETSTSEETAPTSSEDPSSTDPTRSGVAVFNLGTGKGSSVFDVIHAFEQACGKTLPYTICPRRPGDIASCYASCDKAQDELGWVAEYDLNRMCEDAWRWQSSNPNGYES